MMLKCSLDTALRTMTNTVCSYYRAKHFSVKRDLVFCEQLQQLHSKLYIHQLRTKLLFQKNLLQRL